MLDRFGFFIYLIFFGCMVDLEFRYILIGHINYVDDLDYISQVFERQLQNLNER